MKSKKGLNKLNMFEKEVIRALHKLHRPATTNEIATVSGNISWKSAEIALSKLEKMNVVERQTYGKTDYWELNYEEVYGN